VRILKRVLWLFVLPILLLGVLTSLAIAPPHFFIINAGHQAKRASFAVGDGVAEHATVFAGIIFARTDVIESVAVVQITLADGSKRRCQFGYFTHSEFEPHYLAMNDCDDQWH
jgi:hypothetical protein